jgi:DNA uptake protein ComE-like DNA-binding protein
LTIEPGGSVVPTISAKTIQEESSMKFPDRLAIARFLVCTLLFASVGLHVAAGQGSKASSASGTKIDLNSASEKELDSLPGVGPATAKKIIAGRPYGSVSDLSKAGVSSGTITKITPLVAVGGGSVAPASPKTSAAPPPPVASKPAASEPAPPPAPAPKASPAASSQGTPSAGSVWVNLDTGVYHYSNSRYYGKTKSGKYMSEPDAMKAGYHAAKNEKKPQ